MVRAAPPLNSRWRCRQLGLRLLLWLLLAAGPLGAQGTEAPAASNLPSPILNNQLVPPDFGRVPETPSPKARVHSALQKPLLTTPQAESAPAPQPVQASEETPASEKPVPVENPDQISIKGDAYRYEQGVQRVEGHVELQYQDLTIRSQSAEVDKERVWGTFSGDVTLSAKLYKGHANALRINLDTEDFMVEGASVEVEPDFFQSYVAKALYLRAQHVAGSHTLITGTEGIGTSCDLWPDPHWMLRSSTVTVIPDNRVTFHKPTLYLFGHRLFRYPWDLTLSLVRKENRFLPEVGQNEVEGYYAKFAYGYLLGEGSGFLRLNLTQKRGVGYGIDHLLDQVRQHLEVSLFTEPSMGSFSGRVLDRLQLSKLFATNLNMNFQQDSGFGATSSSFSGDLTLRYNTADSQSLLGFQQSVLSSSFSSSRRFSTNFTHTEQLGRNGQWRVQSTYRRSSFVASQVPDEELDTELSYRQQWRAYGLNVQANKRYLLGSGSGSNAANYYQLNRLPDAALSTDSSRLGDFRLLGSAFEAIGYLGFFEQLPEAVRVRRTGVDLRLPGHTQDLGRWANLRTSARFQQMLYSDGSAQWIGELHSNYYQRLSRTWESRLNFDYSRPNGFAPLRLDYASPTSRANLQVVRIVPDRMRLNLSWGRDFYNGYFNDVLARAEVMLTERNRLEVQTGYSIENSTWRPLNLRWIFATPRTWWSALTVNYDIANSDLTNISADIDWNPTPRWRVQFLGGYSNFGGLDQADVQITRDLHCMLASLVYIHSTGEIRFGLGIKAFPSATRTFGIGNRGQYFESNFADQY